MSGYLRGEYVFSPETVHLLYSANRWDSNEKIKALLAEGKTVILDRYWYSGTVYSMARGLSMEWCKVRITGVPRLWGADLRPLQWSDRGLVRPDLVIQLELDVKTASGRAGFGQEVTESLELQTRVATAYETIRMSDLDGIRWEAVDAGEPEDMVAKEVLRLMEGL